MKRYLAIALVLAFALMGLTVLAEGVTASDDAAQSVDPSLIPPMRPVSEFTVYYTQKGKYFHRDPDCGSMHNADAHTLAEAKAAGKKSCPFNNCNPEEGRKVITLDALKMEAPVYVSQDGYWHINFDCESIAGDWTLMEIVDARADATLKPCDACGAIYYAEYTPLYNASNMPASPEVVIDGEVPMLYAIENGGVVVYTSPRNEHYHRSATCPAVPGLTFTPGYLADALLDGKTSCPQCNPAEPIYVEDVFG
ncbi:MAG: hypothetical protein IJJ23_07915 [Clostridia bacterium]|nr:hypothetical protein [Clostridia bacterium]